MAWLEKIIRSKRVDHVETAIGKHNDVVEADPYAYKTAHMRAIRLLRLSSFCLVLSIFANIIQAGAIGNLVPLKSTEVVLIKHDPNDGFYAAEPPDPNIDGMDLYMEDFSARMVVNLLTIDPVSQEARFEQARLSTEASFWDRFYEKRIATRKISEFIRDGNLRHIHIETSELLEEGDNKYVYVVDYTQSDSRDGAIFDQVKGRAWLEVSLLKRTVKSEERYINPFGMTLMNMSLKIRKEANK